MNSAGITKVLWSNSGIYTEVHGGSARACQMPHFSQGGEQVLLLPFSGGGTTQPGSNTALFSSTRGIVAVYWEPLQAWALLLLSRIKASGNWACPLAAECLSSNYSWWPLLWDFIPCLPVQSSQPPPGVEEGWHMSVC